MLLRPDWKTYRYYYNCLSPIEKDAYEDIKDSLRHFDETIHVAPKLAKSVGRVYEAFGLDNPIFFQVSRSIKKFTSKNDCFIIPDYIMNPKEYELYFKDIRQFVLNSRELTKGLKPEEKIRVFHDSFLDNVEYHGRELSSSHNVIGALLKKQAVCESISKAFKLLCDVHQIPCLVVYGFDDEEKLKAYRAKELPNGHAWNMVKLHGNWANVDVTWDINSKGYKYFLRSDELFENHFSRIDGLPPSSADLGPSLLLK